MRRQGGSGGGVRNGGPSYSSIRDGRGGGRDYDRETISTRKRWDPQNSNGLLNSLMEGIIQETLRYRSNIRPMAGVDTLTQVLALSDSDHPEMPFGF